MEHKILPFKVTFKFERQKSDIPRLISSALSKIFTLPRRALLRGSTEVIEHLGKDQYCIVKQGGKV